MGTAWWEWGDIERDYCPRLPPTSPIWKLIERQLIYDDHQVGISQDVSGASIGNHGIERHDRRGRDMYRNQRRPYWQQESQTSLDALCLWGPVSVRLWWRGTGTFTAAVPELPMGYCDVGGAGMVVVAGWWYLSCRLPRQRWGGDHRWASQSLEPRGEVRLSVP